MSVQSIDSQIITENAFWHYFAPQKVKDTEITKKLAVEDSLP